MSGLRKVGMDRQDWLQCAILVVDRGNPFWGNYPRPSRVYCVLI